MTIVIVKCLIRGGGESDFLNEKNFGEAISGAIMKITTYFFFKFSDLNVSTCNTEKSAVKQPLPPKTAIFRRKLTFSGHIRHIFNDNNQILFCKFLELNVPTRKTEKTATGPQLPPKTAVCRRNFFCHFSPN